MASIKIRKKCPHEIVVLAKYKIPVQKPDLEHPGTTFPLVFFFTQRGRPAMLIHNSNTVRVVFQGLRDLPKQSASNWMQKWVFAKRVKYVSLGGAYLDQ